MREVKTYLTNKEDAVAGAVTVVLVIALVSLILGYYVSVIVPSTMSQYEFSMDQGLSSSTLQFASYMTTMKSKGLVGQINYQNFILETNSVPVFTSPTYATLSTTSFVKNLSTSYYIYAPGTGLPTSWFYGGGGLTVSNGNRFYNPAILYYQAGSVYQVTRDKVAPLTPSGIFQYSAGLNTYYLNAFQIYGSIQQTSTGSFDLELEYSGSSTLNTTLIAPLQVTVWFNSTAAGEMFYQTMLAFPNLNPINSTLNNGYAVTFTIPATSTVAFTVSSYTVSTYVQVNG